MKILHYISQIKNDDILSDYVCHLTDALRDVADVYVATYDNDIQQKIDESAPDIVHIHGAWDRYAYRLMKVAASQGYAVVISPHGEIGTYPMMHEQRWAKSIKNADYQRWMIKHSEALLVTSDDERAALETLGWQKRIDVIKPSILDSTVSDRQMADEMMIFYTKVIDTRYRALMTDSEKEAVRSLVHVGMAHDETMPLLDSDRILTLRGLSPTEWRRILLYGDDEDLRLIVDKAAERLQLAIPSIDTSKISRYPSDLPKMMGDLPSDRIIGGYKIMTRKFGEVTENDSEELQQLTTMLINARTLLKKRQMSMRHLAELYDEVKYVDYDETRFVEITKEMKLNKFLRRLLQVMADEAYLEEGFMPDKPLDDSLARKISRQFI